MTSIRQALDQAAGQLRQSSSARLDAEILLAHVLQRNREYLYTWPERELEQQALESYQRLYGLRAKGHPVAYLVGRRAFWNVELEVGPQVLIPRPETELLVELALELVPDRPATVADLGTGSGAVALALAGERPQWQIIATDISPVALNMARRNSVRLQLKNVSFLVGNWCGALAQGGLEAIISNPPYIEPGDPHLDSGDVRFEPEHALISPGRGLADIRLIATQAAVTLKTGGWLLLEHGHTQAPAVVDILRNLSFLDIRTHRDLSGNDRVTLGRRG